MSKKKEFLVSWGLAFLVIGSSTVLILSLVDFQNQWLWALMSFPATVMIYRKREQLMKEGLPDGDNDLVQ